MDDNIILQDNQSTILLENNGKRSSSKRTRHIDIRYYFVTDRIKSKEIRVEYCPTESMVGDYFSKPLQGRLFVKLRNKIMNCEGDDPKSWCDSSHGLDPRSELDEQQDRVVDSIVDKHGNPEPLSHESEPLSPDSIDSASDRDVSLSHGDAGDKHGSACSPHSTHDEESR